jgi:glycine cleavage system H lipoate-binding protein
MTMERVVKVSEQHVWVGVDDQHVHLGLTNYIQAELDRVISVKLPEVGDKSKRARRLRKSNRSRPCTIDRAGVEHECCR